MLNKNIATFALFPLEFKLSQDLHDCDNLKRNGVVNVLVLYTPNDASAITLCWKRNKKIVLNYVLRAVSIPWSLREAHEHA